MTRIMYLIALLLFCLTIQAQKDTVYFDANMKSVKNKAKATQYAVIQPEENGGKLVEFYTIDGKLKRSSQYKEFADKSSKQILHGATHYKFSGTDQDSLFVFYRDNKRYGGGTFYYPNGEVLASCQYKEGSLNGLLKQFYEDGKLKRLEMYENNASVSGKYLAADSTELSFTPFYKAAKYDNNIGELNKIIVKNMDLPGNLVQDMSKKGIERFYYSVGIEVNELGEATGIILLETGHPMFNEKCLAKAASKLKEQSFVPAQMNDKPISDIFVLDDPLMISISPTTTRVERSN